ncbi:MAG: DUF4919 domain-containing protein [Thermodesulfobacteriota bacterium]
MTRFMIFAAAAVLIFSAAGAGFPGEPEDPFKTDVEKFTRWRMEYARSPGFNPVWQAEEERQKILEAFKAQDHASVLSLSRAWLAKCPVDADMHEIRSIACVLQDDYYGFFYHRQILYGLLASIAASGQGLSLEKPMQVISVHEEYDLLRHLRAEVVGQSLVEGPAGPVDKMECKLGDRPVTYYFDVSIPLTWIRKELGGKDQ